MLIDFIGTEVFENDVVVCPSPYFPTLWVKATVKTVENTIGTLEYIDSKNRSKIINVRNYGQFILARGNECVVIENKRTESSLYTY